MNWRAVLKYLLCVVPQNYKSKQYHTNDSGGILPLIGKVVCKERV